MKQKLLFLLTALMLLASGNAWGTDVPTPVYFNTFTSSAGLTIEGDGSFVMDSNPRFGKVFSNAASETPRTNYLVLPDDVLSHSTETKQMSISFWVNAKNAGGASAYTYAPLFSAYGQSPSANAADFAWDNETNAKSTTVHRAGNNENWPVLCISSRGCLELNCGGSWTGFPANLNATGKNNIYNTNAWELDGTHDAEYVSGGNWLDDSAWHLFTLTMTQTKVIIYLDGVVKNEWNLTNTSGGAESVNGFLTNGGDYKYICLGGNEIWDWNDNDAAFMFDDFAVYDAALSAEQIAQIMTDKTTTADITSLSTNYTFNASSTINPFDNGAIWHGTNVDAFLPSIDSNTRGLTATAYFDSNTETAGRQAFAVASGDVVTISMVMYNGWIADQTNNQTSYTIYNSDGTPLVSFTYNSNSCNFSNVSFGGTTVEGFEPFNGISSYNGSNQNANGIDNDSKPFVATSGYNPVITISIAGDGNVSINFVRNKNSAYDKTFSATLSDVKMDLAKIVMLSENYGRGGTNHGDRISGIGYMNFDLKHTVTVKAVDGSSSELATIGIFNVSDGETLNFAYPRYILNGTTVYKKDATNKEYRNTSATITAPQTINVTYPQYATDGYFYTEAEALAGATVATTSGAWTRSSMSAVAYGDNIAVTTLPAGTYKATIGWYGQSGQTCTVNAGETIAVSATQNGSWGETIGGTFTLSEPTNVTMTATGNNYTGIDYILIEKTGVSATIGTEGYATLGSQYPLDLTQADGVKAYKATSVNDETIQFVALEQSVPANTGLLIAGTPGVVTIPVATSSTPVEGENLLKVNASGTTFSAESGCSYYGLLKDSKEFRPFAPGTVAIPANKAYLRVENINSARLVISFDEEDPTAINAIEAAEVNDGTLKDGKYLKNGKIVIVKNGVKYCTNGQKLN